MEAIRMKKNVWWVVTLISLYVGAQLIADVSATKIVDIWGFAIPAGSLVFALTFTLRDLIHKRLGKVWAQASIVLAGVINIFMALNFAWIASLNPAVFVSLEYSEAWSGIFAFVPAIVFGSIIAEVTSEWIDTEVYHRLIDRFTGNMQFVRVLGSNAVSLPIDSIIFGSLAFVLLPPLFGGEALPWGAIPAIVLGQVLFKALVTVASLPLIYLIPERRNEDDWLDEVFIGEQLDDFESVNVQIGDEI